jgi:hypothetical protein
MHAVCCIALSIFGGGRCTGEVMLCRLQQRGFQIIEDRKDAAVASTKFAMGKGAK